MEPIDLDHLEVAAKAATPGPWRVDCPRKNARIKSGDMFVMESYAANAVRLDADAAFIAAANPETILALIRELRELRQEEEVDAALIATLRKDNEAMRAELREHRQADEIQMRTGWTVKSWVPGTPGAKRRFGVVDEHGEWVHGDEYWKHSTFNPKAALIAADKWKKQQEKGGA